MPTALIPPTQAPQTILRCPTTELDIEHTVASGQCFRWLRDADGAWSAAIGADGTILRCRQEPEQVVIETLPDTGNIAAARTYFQMDVDLPTLASQWAEAAGPEIAEALEVFAGLRVTRQDPVECLISFLCSSVAPIYRIRRGIDAMCRTLGEPLGTHWGRTFHAFPTLECLAETPREEYDTMGLGFRGGNVRETSAELLRRGGRPYLLALRHAPYANAKAALITLPGVGAKIADCVCLFSLGKHEAVPMDVHVTRIGKRLFPHLASLKSLTSKNYNDLADAYRDRFGPYAGWAQQYLFYNELLMTGAWDRQMGVHVPGRKK